MPECEHERSRIACRVRSQTTAAWAQAVLSDLDSFLQDHAACERKASATAMTLASHYRDKRLLVDAMVALACEELDHFRRVYEIIASRGGTLGPDTKDRYVVDMLGLVRRGPDVYLLDRLLVAGVVEARGCERFRILGEALDGDLGELYRRFAGGEALHAALFVKLARGYFPDRAVDARLDELLSAEAAVVAALPLRPALH
jgi:tRNA 2-(methylsulfanyl)-N6-isopentenyladenosine37 hydroxylase